ncbi:MAG: hypothetical protein EBR82_22455 [Caulobacteraceae bacterium]|nr:hypothetical protein [Caulobacteraceae bacterium]
MYRCPNCKSEKLTFTEGRMTCCRCRATGDAELFQNPQAEVTAAEVLRRLVAALDAIEFDVVDEPLLALARRVIEKEKRK